MDFQLHVAGGVWMFILFIVAAGFIGHWVGKLLSGSSDSGEGRMNNGLAAIIFIVLGVIASIVALIMLFTTAHAAYAAIAAVFCFGAATGPSLD